MSDLFQNICHSPLRNGGSRKETDMREKAAVQELAAHDCEKKSADQVIACSKVVSAAANLVPRSVRPQENWERDYAAAVIQ